ncbi:hypothetical protein IWW50_002403 [Coemansia erecta]|nr:hypothetical protein IWW50_002403 [Coemansia erecta]
MRLNIRRRIHCFLFHNPVLHDDLFATSYLVQQPILACIRGSLFVYCLSVLISNLAVNIAHGAGWNWAAYFTTLTFFGITLYYGVASYTTIMFAWRRYGVQREAVAPQVDVGSVEVDEGLASLDSEGSVKQNLAECNWVARSEGTVKDRDNVSMSKDGDVTSLTEDRNVAPSNEVRDIASLDEDRDAEPDGITELTTDADPTSNPSESTEITILDPEWAKESTPAYSASPPLPPTLAHQTLLASQLLLYEAFTCFAPLVTLIYWVLLYPTQTDVLDNALNTWMGISMHALNSVLMVLEIGVFAKTPYVWSHLWVLLGCLVMYLGLAYFMVGVYGFYVYPFFEARYFGGYVAVVCLLFVGIVAVVWVVMLMVHRLRDSIYPRWATQA